MNSSDFLELYLTNFFISLGQLTAFGVGATVAFPMYNYYLAKYVRPQVYFMTPEQAGYAGSDIDADDEMSDTDTDMDTVVNSENNQ